MLGQSVDLPMDAVHEGAPRRRRSLLVATPMSGRASREPTRCVRQDNRRSLRRASSGVWSTQWKKILMGQRPTRSSPVREGLIGTTPHT